ncbi:hypothetical protein [Crateriforma spongiae]|uniref:hypothetical protein n=1 Tax=Crateriforma spongiae TaxID=2724528 RepID=UPI0014450D31|nr:hypothetical protein [Crateriforma spongiae]
MTTTQERLVAYGARSLGTIVHAFGFDSADDLHKRTADWLIRLTSNRHLQIAGFAIHALGDLGIPPHAVQQRLEDLIVGPKRKDDLPVITCRGTAFRILATLDRSLATRYTDTPAAREYLAAIDHWLAAGSEDPKLHDDLKWLRAE